MGQMRFRKIAEDADELIVSNEIRLSKGSTLKVKGYRGNTVAEFMENGDVKIKGRVIKR